MKLVPTLSSALLAAVAVHAQTPVLIWDCSHIPNVCENMCWGVYCSGHKASWLTLNYDASASASTKAANRKNAGCLPSPNRCSSTKFGTTGYSCDEFPFASTKEGTQAKGETVNRCVPARENSSQGGQLAAFYKKNCPTTGTCEYKMAFTKYDPKTSFCAAAPTNFTKVCTNTKAYPPGGSFDPKATKKPDQEYLGAQGTVALAPKQWKRDEGAHPHGPSQVRRSTQQYTYKLANGKTITSWIPLDVGAATYMYEAKKALDAYPDDETASSDEALEKEFESVDAANAAAFTAETSTIKQQVK